MTLRDDIDAALTPDVAGLVARAKLVEDVVAAAMATWPDVFTMDRNAHHQLSLATYRLREHDAKAAEGGGT